MKKTFSIGMMLFSFLLVVALTMVAMLSVAAAEDHNVMLTAEDHNVFLNATGAEEQPTGSGLDRQHVVLYDEDFEPEDDTKIKSPIRSEVGKSKVVDELPDREGSGVCVNMIYDKVMIGVQPKGIGNVLYPYGEFVEGDTFHFQMDVYLDIDQETDFYPFVLLCIGGGATNREEKDYNYDEWYPKEADGSALNVRGVKTIQPRTWTTVEYIFTVKDGCTDKGRNVSFYTDAGAFYLYFGSKVLNKDIYVDNVLIEMDTAADPNSRELPTAAPKTTVKEPTLTPATTESQVTPTEVTEPSDIPTETAPLPTKENDKTVPSAEPTVMPTVTPTESVTEPDAVLYGDANDDGMVNMKDVLTVRKYLASIEVAINLKSADYTQDGAVNMKDVLGLRKFISSGL